MWNIFDQWIVILALGWAVWVIYRSLSKKSFLSCSTPCNKKIFRKEAEIVGIKRKHREKLL
ncbi:MAG TPA: hypothetical protein VEL47_06295 [Myxococcota bacterium]|nr:hypothetical protein [Myxococcota bacterium]